MSDEYGNVDLKEYAKALSEVINKAMEGVKQPMGKNGSCWLRKPTKEEMENHPWEGVTTND